jgi:hypothetical protein
MSGRTRALIWAFFIGFASVAARAQVTVEKRPPVIERKTFDPAKRPSDMPELKAGEAAVTESRFDCTAQLTYKVTERKTTDTNCSVLLRVLAVQVTLSAKVVVWLPASAPGQLAAHEEGHRQIDQRVYDEAIGEVEKRAKLLEGQTLHASAADCDVAEKKATQAAADAFCDDYLKMIGNRSGRVNDAYDKITAHGIKSEPSPELAVSKAFECDRTDGRRQ